ncbi:MAG: hypothetical protein US49_C0001G0166 [candidate division TM6 bacterium GW2011_GWF2_37_49]|nr:MAG: hypothetical protein US49_C0001G0166 [candidate division TM6 bacterium GW2011_GWF2_37_49]
MKLLKQYLALVVIFLAGSTNAMNSDELVSQAVDMQPQEVQAAKIAAPKPAVVKKFEKLVEAAMRADKASVNMRVGAGVLKEFLKIFSPLFILLIHMCGTKNRDFVALIIYLLTLYPPFTLILMCSSSLMWEFVFNYISDNDLSTVSDKSLVALRALQRHVNSLTPEEKKEIALQFKEKYAHKLSEKITKEKDGKGLVIGRSAMSILTGVGMPLIYIFIMRKFKLNESLARSIKISDKTANGFIYTMATLHALAAAYNAWYSNDYQEKCALQEIEAALA